VDAKSKNNSGFTPLTWTARKGNEAVVRLFLEREDVDISPKDIFGYTPLT